MHNSDDLEFNPAAHYWRLADGRVWSGAVAAYVPDTGQAATPVTDTTELREIMLQWLPDQARLILVTVDDVRAEASRRLQVLFGARDSMHLDHIISNGQSEAIRLLRKGPENWTPEEAARATALETFDLAKDTIRAASNVLEAIDPVPADYTDDRWWP